MERRGAVARRWWPAAERATALGGARVLAIYVAIIRGKIDHPPAATSGGRPEDAKPFQIDDSREPFFPPARFRDLAMRPSQTGVVSLSSSRPWARFDVFLLDWSPYVFGSRQRAPPYGTRCPNGIAAPELPRFWPCRRDKERRKNRRGGHSDRVSRRSSAVRRKIKGVTMTVPSNVLLQRCASALRIPFRYAARRVPRRVGTFG